MKVKKLKMSNKATLARIAASALLTIGFCITVNLLLNLLCNSWEKLFSALGNIGSVIIGAGMFYLGWQQHQHLKQQISEQEKSTIKDHFNRFLDITYRANYFIMGGGKHLKIKPEKVLYDLSILESEIGIYSKELYKPIQELNLIYRSIGESHKEAADKRTEEGEIINKIKNLFSEYLKIPNKNL